RRARANDVIEATASARRFLRLLIEISRLAGMGSVNQPGRERHGTDAHSHRQRGDIGVGSQRERGGVDMTRTTNARVAGFTYLFYAAIGICLELLMHQARGVGVGSDAAKLAHIGQYATNVRLTILIALLECLSSLV